MKTALHPTYHSTSKVHCAGCNRDFTVGSTIEQINVELCSNCHPLYTGKQKLVDTAGRVDRFRARAAQVKTNKKASETKTDEKTDADVPSTNERLAQIRDELSEQQ